MTSEWGIGCNAHSKEKGNETLVFTLVGNEKDVSGSHRDGAPLVSLY